MWYGLIAAILWPGYGIFCDKFLHLREFMGLRYSLGVCCALLWLRSRSPRTWGHLERWAWFTHSVVGLGWLPWHLYFVNGRDAYWQMSIVCFAVAVPISLRGTDMALALVAMVLAVGATHGSEIGNQDIPLFAVVTFMTSLMTTGVYVWRRSQRRIEEQSALLEQQNIRLRELDRSKDEFTANVAHDLRTPLAVALCLTEELGRDKSPQDIKRLESLAGALHQLHRQSEELLDFQRFQLGIAKLDRQNTNLCAWLEKYQQGFASMAHSRGISLRVAAPPEPIHGYIDPIRLETALFNLVSNAFKFTPSGRWVEIQLQARGERDIVLAVEDSGEGIPPESVHRIFERFQQVDRGPGTHTSGAGIGLSLVKEIAQAHGGSIQVHSIPSKGSRFELVLEGARVQSAIEAAPDPCQEMDHPRTDFRFRSGTIVLIAEDQPVLRHLLKEVLGRMAEIVTASDGKEAYRLAKELQPSLLVTDNQMPGMDGIDVVALLRADATIRHIPVILLTGESESIDARLGLESDVVVVRKPFHRGELMEQVDRILARTLSPSKHPA